jgi:hypothetical protein
MATTPTTATTGTTGLADDIDPLTGKKRVASPTVATQNPSDPNATVALSPEALSGGAVTTANNTAVLNQAQTEVLGQPGQSDLQKATSQSALNWVQNPMGDFDPQKNKQQRMEKANSDWGKAFEATRQQYGNVSGSGLLQENMLGNTLQHNVDMSDLESKLDQENYNRYIDSIGKSIAAGQSVSKSDMDAFTNRLKNYETVRGMAEGEATRTSAEKLGGLDRAHELLMQSNDQQGQKDIAELQGRIKMNEILTSQDFDSAQAALDRALKTALQAGDIEGQKEITKLKADLDLQAQESQNRWLDGQRTATQKWQSDERISQNNYNDTVAWFDRETKMAIQKNDIEAQKFLASQKAMLDLKMQTQNLTHDEAMRKLDAQLAEAKAGNDFVRERNIIEFKTTQELTRMAKENGYTTALETMKETAALALQKNDFTQAQTIQLTMLTFQESEGKKNRDLDQARIDLQERGVDMEEADRQYAKLVAEVEAGRADPSSLTDFVSGVMKKAGVTIKPPDPKATAKAATEKYNNMVGQYALTHPDMVIAWDIARNMPSDSVQVKDLQTNPAAFKGFELRPTKEAMASFNEYFNESVYGEESATTKREKDSAGMLGASDIASATPADKFLFDKPVTYNGQTIPAGKYSVQQSSSDVGSEFFGNKVTVTTTKLVDEKGNTYKVKEERGAPKGNFLSQGWAMDEWN